MIYTVTLNPAVDRTVPLTAPFALGTVNRVLHAEERAGGKGINVSRALRMDGVPNVAYTVLGGKTGDFIAAILEQEKIACRFMRTPYTTRTNTKLVAPDGVVTECNEIGAPIPEDSIRAFMRALVEDALREPSPPAVLLCGSAPYGAGSTIYNYLVTLLHQVGCPVWVDCDGALLAEALRAKPQLVKPNLDEISALVGHPVTPETAAAEATALYEKTGTPVLLTMGAHGAVFAGKEGTFSQAAFPLEGEVRTTVGAGDTFLAAFAAGLLSFKMPVHIALEDAARMTAKRMQTLGREDVILPENYDEMVRAALGPMKVYESEPERDPIYALTSAGEAHFASLQKTPSDPE